MEFITLNPILCVGWIIVGALAGGLARQITKSQDEPLINDIILGWLGVIVGGLIGSILGFGRPEGGLERVIVNLIFGVVGAVVLITVMRMIRGQGKAKR